MFLMIDKDNSAVQIDFDAPSLQGVRSKMSLYSISVLSYDRVNRLMKNWQKQFYHVVLRL